MHTYTHRLECRLRSQAKTGFLPQPCPRLGQPLPIMPFNTGPSLLLASAESEGQTGLGPNEQLSSMDWMSLSLPLSHLSLSLCFSSLSLSHSLFISLSLYPSDLKLHFYLTFHFDLFPGWLVFPCVYTDPLVAVFVHALSHLYSALVVL